jgi:glutamate-ammonia-ligase adenylyltransferase
MRGADRLSAYLLDGVLDSPDPDAAMSFLADLLTHPHATAILNYLRAKPATLRAVMTLFGSSSFLARRLVRNPHWIDWALGSGAPLLQGAVHLQEGWKKLSDAVESLEARLNLLRRFQAQHTFRIALAYLERVVDDEQLGQQLTSLAEHCLDVALEEARADLSQLGDLSRFGVIGAGRLGSRELGFGSDLDLIFVFDDEADAVGRYARLARRLIHFLDTPMRDGALYRVDLDLRPDGGHGTVITTVEALARYYRERADPWERVALLRARVVAGTRALGGSLAAIQQRAAGVTSAELPGLAAELARVRGRLVAEVARPGGGQYHLKYGVGGLLDIELSVHLTRFLALANGQALVVEGGQRVMAVASQLEAIGALTAGEVEQLGEAYRFYRRLQNVVRLTLDRSLDRLDPSDASVSRARTLLARDDAELARPEALAAALQRHMSRVAAIYDRRVAALSKGG